MKRFLADLHIHTALSPCAEREMTPPAIVREALARGLSLIAVCDHNSAGNTIAVAAAAAAACARNAAADSAAAAACSGETPTASLDSATRSGNAVGGSATTAASSGNTPTVSPDAAARLGTRASRTGGGPLVVIPGIEITTMEEVHVLGLFPDAAAAARAAKDVREGLPMWKALTAFGPGDSLRKPEQELMDSEGKVTGIEEKMLAAASTFSLAGVVSLIREHGGLAVAAHVDRRAFSVIGQLGFFPPDVAFDALEISAAGAGRGKASEFGDLGAPLVSSSDSHFLSDIGASMTALELEEPSFEEIRLAFKGAGGRKCGIA